MKRLLAALALVMLVAPVGAGCRSPEHYRPSGYDPLEKRENRVFRPADGNTVFVRDHL
jgi:hypothetical protein